MENTVEMNNMQGLVPDDAALQPQQEQETPLTEVTEGTAPVVEEQQQPAVKEPGWIRQRIDKAVQRALQEQEQRLRAEFEATTAPLRESMYEQQAAALVSSGEFKTQERALEYVRLKAGMSVPATPAEAQQPPRDEQGRFTTRQQQPEENAESKVRANILASQAEKIKERRGLDVMQAFQNSPGIQQKVLSGEWDFYDVAEAMRSSRVPAPMRSTNGVSFEGLSINQMSDEQFDLLSKSLAAGKTYR